MLTYKQPRTLQCWPVNNLGRYPDSESADLQTAGAMTGGVARTSGTHLTTQWTVEPLPVAPGSLIGTSVWSRRNRLVFLMAPASCSTRTPPHPPSTPPPPVPRLHLLAPCPSPYNRYTALSVSLCLSLSSVSYLSAVVPLSRILRLPSHSLATPTSLYLCLPLSLWLSLCVSVSLSLCLSLCVSLSVFVSVCLSV